jgi:hypothetical protein
MLRDRGIKIEDFNIKFRDQLETMYTYPQLYSGSIENLRAHLSIETNFNYFCQVIQNFLGTIIYLHKI